MTERIMAAFVPLVDCAVLVAAHECGFAREQGIDLELVREPSWASLRDHLALGHVDCAHALAPLPVALRLGVGYPPADCVVPFVLSRGGNAITLAASLFEQMRAAVGDVAIDENPLAASRALAAVAAMRAEPLTLGVVFPFSNHNFDLRYWLAAGGLHPDRDVRLVAIPPPLMVEALGAGAVDGFCVGEPWNSAAVARGLGAVVTTQSQLFPHAVEKVLAVRGAFAADAARLEPLLRALAAAAAWADDSANHAELARLLARAEYVGVDAKLMHAPLAGRLDLGVGRRRSDLDFMYFSRHDGNRPDAVHGKWAYAQMVRWGQIAASPAGESIAAGTFRPDLYRRCLPQAAAQDARVASFDGATFAGTRIEQYLARFSMSTAYSSRASG